MFIPVLGRGGSGKTSWMLQKAGELGCAGEKVIFLVPEQFSFETERNVYRTYGAKAALNIEVLSFTRLCTKVFYRYGGIAGEYISDTARQLLMSLAVNELKDKLEICSAFGKNPAYGEVLLNLVEEFKRAGISPQQVLETAESLHPEAFAAKMTELGEIYGVYQAMVERSYLDSADDEARCARLLEGKAFFADCTVIVDSFMTYMAGEYSLLQQIFASAKDVYISFVCPSLTEETGMGPFSVPAKTANRLIRDAKAAGCRVAKPIELGESKRFKHPALAFVEKNFPLDKTEAFEGEKESVRLVRAADPYDEVLYTAASISQLVREKGWKYGEIAVIGRSLERYQGAVQDIFARYEIPVFMDMREDVSAIPIISGVVSALEAVGKGLDTAALLSLAKSTLQGFTAQEIGQLENYCYIWRVKGSAFSVPFTANPQGLSTEFTQEDKKLLEKINQTRERLITPLLALRERVKEATGQDFALAVYRFLEDIQAKENISAYLEKEQEGGAARQYIQRNAAGWSLLMETLGIFAKVLGDRSLPYTQYIELLRNALYSQDIGSVPHTQDQVMVGMADRIRPNSPKAVFVIGANEGLFPAPAIPGGIFSDTERQALIDKGLEISPPAAEKSLYESYYAYFALTSASHQLTVSWHGGLLQGEPQKPSEIVRRLTALLKLPVLSTARLPWEYFVGGGLSLLDEACRRLREDTPESAALVEAAKNSKGSAQMKRVLDSLHQEGFALKDKEGAAALFGKRMKLSPSRIEDYHKCPFRFFCYSGLRLKPRRQVEFSPLESGNVIHYVLEKMLSGQSVEGLAALSGQEIRSRIGQLLREYLALHLTDEEDVTARLQYLFVRLENSVTRLVLHLVRELSQSRFVPCGFEMDLSQNPNVTPLVLRCEDGTEVEIIGKIDRVDKMENEDARYLRIVDYKSGTKQFRLGDVYHGLNLQMLVYLFTLWKNGKNQFADSLPAGILYMPSGDKMITASRDVGEEDLEKNRDKHYKMNGLLLEDLIVVRGMEESGLGVYIPASIKKDGSLSAASSVVNLAQMGLLSRYIQHLIVQMANNLHQGKIAPLPVSGQGYDPCSYCEYTAVCGREKGDPSFELTALDKEELFELLKEEKEL